MDFATQGNDQRLDVGENHRGRSRFGEYGPQGFALLGVQEGNASEKSNPMQSLFASNIKVPPYPNELSLLDIARA